MGPNEKVRLLAIDQDFARSIDAIDPIVLLPHLDYEPKWSISKKQYELMIPAAVKVNRKIAGLFARDVYCRKLNYKPEAAEVLFYMSGTLIVFLLCDRLIRINGLYKNRGVGDFAVPEVNYIFDTSITTSESFKGIIEADPIFNQWVLNRLLPEVPRVSAEFSNVPTFEKTSNLPFTKRLLLKVRSVIIKEGVAGLVSRLFLRMAAFVAPVLHSFLKRFALRAIPHHLTHCDGAFIEKGFHWPKGPLFDLPEALPAFLPNQGSDVKIDRSDFSIVSDEIQYIFREFLLDCQEPDCIDSKTFEALSDLVVELQSEVAIEFAPQACKWAIGELLPFKSDAYLTGFPAAGILPSLYTFAAKQLGRTVVSMQHSAWGGYLARGALITEWLVLGSDDYVTFGWEEVEDGMSSWTRRAIPLPGPFLSHYALAAKSKLVSNYDVKHRVLLATGFLYRFPTIPNSSLKLDTINVWAKDLEKIVKAITDIGVEVTIVMYNDIMAEIHRSVLDRMLAAGGGLAVEHSNHNFRVRELIFSGKFYEHFDAVIWDLPAGGFSEALTSGINTFALCDDNLISILPEGEPNLRELKANGILFESGEQLKISLGKMYLDRDWYRNEDIQTALEKFQNRFCRVSPYWEKDWRTFFDSYT